MTYNPLIIALDVETAHQALQLVDVLEDSVDFYKVGLELFVAEGPEIVRNLTLRRKHVFLDLKMFDIGETVKRATARVADLGATFLTVHAHPQVIAAAKAGASGTPLKVIAVTVLTSFDQRDLEAYGITGRPVVDQVKLLADNGLNAGADGFVCSPLEVATLRQIAGPGAILITPGVRSAHADHGDQKRVATPAQAIKSGASYLVIGRQVTKSQFPKTEVDRIRLHELVSEGPSEA